MQSIQEEPEDVGKALSDSIESVLEKCKVLQETAAGYSRRLKAEGEALGSKVITTQHGTRGMPVGIHSHANLGVMKTARDYKTSLVGKDAV